MAAVIDHVNVVVVRMNQAMAFYGDVLGLSPVMDRELSGAWFESVTGLKAARARCVILASSDGRLRVELLQFLEPASAPAPLHAPSDRGLRHFAVRVDDLDHCLAVLDTNYGQRPVTVQVPSDIVKGGKRMCYARDPDGALVELCQYGTDSPEFC